MWWMAPAGFQRLPTCFTSFFLSSFHSRKHDLSEIRIRSLFSPFGLAPGQLANVPLAFPAHGSQTLSSRSVELVAQGEDAAEYYQHQHARPGHIQQETATLDKDRHDRVTWLRRPK